MTLYIEHPQISSKRLLELINKFSKEAGIQNQPKKSVAFLYGNHESTKKEIQKTISLTITSKIIKYLGINLTKEVKDLYNENYKTLKKEIEGDLS